MHGDAEHPRRGVNAFGFAGVNASAILEEHAATADGIAEGRLLHWDSEAILLGADDRDGWVALAKAFWTGWKPARTHPSVRKTWPRL